MDFSVPNLDTGVPFAPSEPNTFEAVPVVSANSAVMGILASVNLSQVDKTIVVSNTVDVIDLMIWPATVGVKPDQSVCEILCAIDRDINVPIGIQLPSESRTIEAFGWLKAPKMASVRVIAEKIMKALLCERQAVCLSWCSHIRLSLAAAWLGWRDLWQGRAARLVTYPKLVALLSPYFVMEA